MTLARVIVRTLKAGIATLVAEPQRLEAHATANLDYEAEEAAALRTKFMAEQPNVIFQYPRTNSPLPLYAVVLAGEEESDPAYLDDYVGRAGAGPPTLGSAAPPDGIHPSTTVRGVPWEHEYWIMVATPAPDVTLWYYEIAKLIMITARNQLRGCDVWFSRLGGKDLGPDSGYLTDGIWIRSLIFSGTREQRVFDETGFTISGLIGPSVNEPGAPDTIERNVNVEIVNPAADT